MAELSPQPFGFTPGLGLAGARQMLIYLEPMQTVVAAQLTLRSYNFV